MAVAQSMKHWPDLGNLTVLLTCITMFSTPFAPHFAAGAHYLMQHNSKDQSCFSDRYLLGGHVMPAQASKKYCGELVSQSLFKRKYSNV